MEIAMVTSGMSTHHYVALGANGRTGGTFEFVSDITTCSGHYGSSKSSASENERGRIILGGERTLGGLRSLGVSKLEKKYQYVNPIDDISGKHLE
jgi:hypothetical protein